MKIIIRVAKGEEIPEVLALAKELFPNRLILKKPDDTFLIAVKDSELIGFVHIARIKGRVVIQGIGVARDFQNKGLGSSLIDYALGKLQKEDEVYLKVKEGNIPALSLYSKYGFFLKKCGKRYVLCRAKPT